MRNNIMALPGTPGDPSASSFEQDYTAAKCLKCGLCLEACPKHTCLSNLFSVQNITEYTFLFVQSAGRVIPEAFARIPPDDSLCLLLPIRKKRLHPVFHILLEVAVEKLVIIDVIGSGGKYCKLCGIGFNIKPRNL